MTMATEKLQLIRETTKSETGEKQASRFRSNGYTVLPW